MSDKEKKKKQKATEPEAVDNKGRKKSKSSLAKRILKISAWTFGIIFAILFLVLIFRDSLIKFGVTRIGSWIAGVEISMDSFDTSLTAGTVHLKGLRVANPAGFERQNMVDLEEFFLDIDTASLFTKEIVIEEIRVAGLESNAEFNRDGKFNITTLTADLKRRFPPKEDAEAKNEEKEEEKPADAPAPSAGKEEKELKPVLLIRNINAKIKLSMIHDLSGASFVLPVSYSTTDLRIDPNEQSMPLVDILDAAAQALENFCQACFNAGSLLITAGAEAGETLKLGIDSGISAGQEAIKQGGKVLQQSGAAIIQGGESLKKGGDEVLKQGKDLFESAGKLFKRTK